MSIDSNRSLSQASSGSNQIVLQSLLGKKHHLAENNMTGFTSAVRIHSAPLDHQSVGGSLRHAAAAFAVILAAAGPMIANAATRVTGEPARASSQKSAALENSFVSGFDVAAPTVNFFAVNPDRIEQAKAANLGKFRKATQIGITQLTAEEAFDASDVNLRWKAAPSGGHVAQLKIRSPGAIATRVAVQLTNLPAGSEIRFAGSDAPSNVIHAATLNEVFSSLVESGRYWTPMTEGDTQLIEVFAPTKPDGAGVTVAAVSHIFASVSNGFKAALLSKAAIYACYVDPACTSQTQASINSKNATAHMVYQSGAGSFVCTGTLLNDSVPASQIPYFFSANHCLSTQTEANTLTTYWNYENAICSAPNIVSTNPSVTAVQGGAMLLYANEPSDVLLLQLRGNVPPTAFFAGWDSSAIGGSVSATVFHHPGGDPKKVSSGVTISSPFINIQMNDGLGSFINFGYLSSSTEGGSSGSGLFSADGGNYFFRGGLLGGEALCTNTGSVSNPLNRDWYSRFDQAYPLLKQWLDPTPTTLPPLSKRGGIDLDGNNKSALLVSASVGLTQAGRLVNNTFQWSGSPFLHPGQNFRLLGAVDFAGTGKSDLAALQTSPLNPSGQGEARLFRNFDIFSGGTSLRLVKPAWDVQAVGDLDGDGFGDLVWRFQGQSPNIDDQGVSYIWFTDGNGVTQVRKRGGAPLTWKLLGAADLNGDGAADMVYVSPDNVVRVLMATPSRTCANLSGGTIAAGSTAIKLADFTGNRRGDILARNAATGGIQVISLSAAGLTLPSYTGAPDDPNASCTSSSLSVTQTASYTFASDPTWSIFATGDFNGDGIFDIVFMQPNRTLTVWQMNPNGAAPTVFNAGTAPANFSAFPLQ
ncbi:MAG: FG-GAP repeat protein [Rhodocyclaceae bacterium]|nr:FG-GAP repeat protein [Rhodocyclaceae bacterium]MCA3083494.1 FG-GAP repeat protein [Rhodocyclaceae bacterium]